MYLHKPHLIGKDQNSLNNQMPFQNHIFILQENKYLIKKLKKS